MHPFLTYGALALCVACLGFGLWLGSKKAALRLPRVARWSLAFQIAPFAMAYFVLRPGSGLADTSKIQAALDEGRPVLLDLYSNY